MEHTDRGHELRPEHQDSKIGTRELYICTPFIDWYIFHTMQLLHTRVLTTTWLSILAGVAAAATVDLKAVLSIAEWSENTTIAYPGSVDYEDATERWSIYDPPTYSAVVSPGVEADVVQAVSIFPTYRGGGNTMRASINMYFRSN